MKYLLLTLLLLNSCILIPFTEPDEQAKGEIYSSGSACTSCPRRANSRGRNEARHSKEIYRLVRLLDSQSDAVRTNASTDLGGMGPIAISAVPTLEILAKNDQSKWVRRSAVKALQKIGSPSSIAVLTIVSRNDSNEFVRHSANNALVKMKSESRSQLK